MNKDYLFGIIIMSMILILGLWGAILVASEMHNSLEYKSCVLMGHSKEIIYEENKYFDKCLIIEDGE